MDIDISKLKKYDIEHAKAGDKLILGYLPPYGRTYWTFGTCTIKSVSAKRRDITLDDRASTRFDKHGRRLGRDRYDKSNEILLEYDKENIATVNKYTKHNNLVRKIGEALEKLAEKRGGLLNEMPTAELEQFYEMVKRFCGREREI